MTNRNIETVKATYAAFKRGDLEVVIAALAHDVAWENHGNVKHYPVLGKRKGPEEVREFFQKVGASHTFDAFDVDEYYGDGDTVIVLGRYKATVHKTGRTIDTPFAHVYTFRDAKVARFREYTDTATWAEAYRG